MSEKGARFERIPSVFSGVPQIGHILIQQEEMLSNF
jgi:hypothetical protein